LFDNGIFGEPSPSRADFTDSELRNELLGRMPWSKKRRLCEQVGELLRHRRDSLDEAADSFYRAHRYGDARVCRMQAAEEACHRGQYTKAFKLLQQALEIWPSGEDVDKRNARLAHREDQDVSEMLHDMCREEGIEVVTSARITRVEGKSGEWVKFHVVRDESEMNLEGSHILVASGRTPTLRVSAWRWPELKQPTVVT
jgi:hypothetical protein